MPTGSGDLARGTQSGILLASAGHVGRPACLLRPVDQPLIGAVHAARVTPAEGNRLAGEASPYLLQHKDNPVRWWPWCDEAFAEARRRDVPVFLSIGYATCHWCHVMAHESFEDDAVAALLNEHMVCIKVDREERPDLDDIYMAVCQATTGSGGWPLTVALTPEREPFFAGTYFPKESRAHRIGMMDLVPKLAEVWRDKRDEVVASAQHLVEHIRQPLGSSAGAGSTARGTEPPGEAALHTAFKQLMERFDAQRGGFGRAPKFPSSHLLLFLLRYWKRTGKQEPLAMVTTTLDAMARGGVRDHIGGGFHRYSTDTEWLLPHFEKMLYDQAMLAMAYTDAWLATGKEDYESVAREILDYVLRDLQQPEGGFASAEDADSEGEEGLFYTWTHAELAALGTEADLFCDAYGAKAEGNHDDEATRQPTGRNVLYLPEPLEQVATRHGVSVDALEQRLAACRDKLLRLREDRVRPLLDDKVLTDWNGLAISALARAAQAFDEPRYAEAAQRAARFVLDKLMPEGQLRHRYRAGHVDDLSFLDDHAFLANGLIDLYEATFDPVWLEAAGGVADALHPFKSELGAFYLAPPRTDLVARRLDAYDGALPSGNSVAALMLIRLARMTGEPAWQTMAADVMGAFADALNRHPSALAMMLCALDHELGPAKEIVVAGNPARHDTQELLATIRMAYQPNRVLLARAGDGGTTDLHLARVAPWTAHHDPVGGKAAAYVCIDHACRQPITDFHYLQRELT